MFLSFLLGMSDEGITRLPSRENIKRRIRKLRYNNDPVPPSILCKTLKASSVLGL